MNDFIFRPSIGKSTALRDAVVAIVANEAKYQTDLAFANTRGLGWHKREGQSIRSFEDWKWAMSEDILEMEVLAGHINRPIVVYNAVETPEEHEVVHMGAPSILGRHPEYSEHLTPIFLVISIHSYLV